MESMIGSALVAMGLLTGSVDTGVFTCWVDKILLPNIPEKMIEAAGHTLLYLPPYSPDLNPIEKKWAHAKHILRTTDCSIDEIFSTYLRTSFIRS